MSGTLTYVRKCVLRTNLLPPSLPPYPPTHLPATYVFTEREEEREAEQGRSRLERRVGGELQVEPDQAEDVVGKAASPDLGLELGLGLGLGLRLGFGFGLGIGLRVRVRVGVRVRAATLGLLVDDARHE